MKYGVESCTQSKGRVVVTVESQPFTSASLGVVLKTLMEDAISDDLKETPH
jgi:hypothetical protein